MIKVICLALAGIATSTTAFAGSVAFVAPVVPEMVVEEPGSMGGSGIWLIPLLLIALIFLTTQTEADQGGQTQIDPP